MREKVGGGVGGIEISRQADREEGGGKRRDGRERWKERGGREERREGDHNIYCSMLFEQ